MNQGEQMRRWVGRDRAVVVRGGTLAASILVRQSAIGLPLVVALAAAVVNRGRGTPYHRRWPLPVGATVVLVTFLLLLPWALRNYRVLGEWVWTATNGGITLYDGFNPDATGASDQSFVATMPELRPMGELGRSEYLSGLAKQFVRQQPRRAAELAAIQPARMWSPVPLSQEYGGWKYRTVGLLYTVPLFVLAFLGLIRDPAGGGGLPRAAKVLLLIPAIYFTAVHMLSVGSLRYRVPAEPPMAVIAASAAALPVASFHCARVSHAAPGMRRSASPRCCRSTPPLTARVPIPFLPETFRRCPNPASHRTDCSTARGGGGTPFARRTGRTRRWTMTALLLLLCAVIYTYSHLTDAARVRQMAETYLSTLLGGHVVVGRATLSVFEGLRLDDVEVYAEQPQPEGEPAVLGPASPDSLLFSAKTFIIKYDPA